MPDQPHICARRASIRHLFKVAVVLVGILYQGPAFGQGAPTELPELDPTLAQDPAIAKTAPHARLQPPNAYQIDNVAVDVTASTASIARDIAIRRGQRQALEILLERLTIAEDRQSIPGLDDAGVAALVLSIQFKNERYSSTRYISDLVITFSQQGVRRLLDISGSGFSETMARPILVLPYYQNSGLSIVWDDRNSWLETWRQVDWRSSLVPFILPEPEQGAGFTAFDDGGAYGLEESTTLLADLYGTAETLVVLASDSIDFLTGAAQLDVKAIRRGGGMEDIREYIFEPEPDEEPEAMLMRVAKTIGEGIAQEWKLRTLVSLDQMARLEAQVPLSSLEDWVQMKKRLELVPVVKDVVLNELNVSRAVLTLNYLGTQEQLYATLQQYGIGMEQHQQHWVLVFQ
jgi:hypothetical protein